MKSALPLGYQLNLWDLCLCANVLVLRTIVKCLFNIVAVVSIRVKTVPFNAIKYCAFLVLCWKQDPLG